MIYFCPTREAWVDQNNLNFKVPPAPKQGDEEMGRLFETPEEFYEWYWKEDKE